MRERKAFLGGRGGGRKRVEVGDSYGRCGGPFLFFLPDNCDDGGGGGGAHFLFPYQPGGEGEKNSTLN